MTSDMEDARRLVRTMFLVCLTLIACFFALALIAIYRPDHPKPKPDRRLERICWTVKNSLAIQHKLEQSTDPGIVRPAKVMILAYDPIDQACDEKP